MKWVFEEIAKGVFAADQVRQEANKKGLKISRSAFWTTIRNGNEYRTSRLNEVVRLIYTLGKGLSEIKNRKSDALAHLSGEVVLTGIEPVSKV